MKRQVVALVLVIMPWSGFAHHSRMEFAAEFQEIVGDLVAINWSNPHPTFEMEVAGSDGPEQWHVQVYGTVYTLRRAGVTGDHFQPGDAVRLYGHVSNRRGNVFLVQNLLLPDGTEVVMRRDGAPIWEDAVFIGGEANFVRTEADFADALAENRGIFRGWSRPIQNETTYRRDIPPLTEDAAAALAAADPLLETSQVCVPKGMPMAMFTPEPFEFLDNGDTITVRGNEFGIVRTIHLSDAGDPSDQPYSHLGYSVGRWEGNTLVIETSRINWPFFDPFGTPQTDAVEVVERFTLSDDQRRLDWQSTITDPGTFVGEAAVVTGFWVALGETPQQFKCAVDKSTEPQAPAARG